jgi:hypothetical protein
MARVSDAGAPQNEAAELPRERERTQEREALQYE